MATILVPRPGFAVQLSAEVPTGNVLLIGGTINNLTNSYQVYSCIVTGLMYDTAGGVQLLHSLNDMIYAYTFGERIGNLVVTGVAVAGRCEEENALNTGVDGILQYYDENRMSRIGAAVQLVIGRTKAGRLRGFLQGMRLGMTNPETRVSDFAMHFRSFSDTSEVNL